MTATRTSTEALTATTPSSPSLGSGLRRHNLANITTYEVPPLTALPLTTMRVADRITKGDAGGDSLVFTHRLGTFTATSTEPARTRARPAATCLSARCTLSKPTQRRCAMRRMEQPARPGGPTSTQPVGAVWSTPTARPLLFLNEYTGKPLTYSAFQHAVAGARDFVRDRIETGLPAEPAPARPPTHLRGASHDGRSPGVLSESVDAARRSDWTVDHIAAAVEMVKLSLGHASDQSTRLYVQTAHRFLTIPEATSLESTDGSPDARATPLRHLRNHPTDWRQS